MIKILTIFILYLTNTILTLKTAYDFKTGLFKFNTIPSGIN